MSEKKSKKAVDSRLIQRLFLFIKPYLPLVIGSLTITLAIAFLGPYRPLLIQKALDDYVSVGDLEGLKWIILQIVGILLAESLLTVANVYTMNYIGQGTLYRIRNAVYQKLLSLHVQYFDKNPIGRLVTRTTNDIEAIDELVSTGVVNMLGDSFRIIFILYFMFSMDVKLTLISLSTLPILIWSTNVFKNKVRVSFLKVRDQIARLNAFVQEHIQGMSTVQLFNRENEEMSRFTQINEEHRKAHIKTIYYFSIFWPVVEILATTGMALVIWFGGASVLVDGLTFGVLVAFIQYVRLFFQPIRDISEKFNTLQSALAATERIADVLDTTNELVVPSKPTDLQQVKGKIEFKQVWFSYTKEGNRLMGNLLDTDLKNQLLNDPSYVLKDISFEIQPGKMIAFVGATGAGKTSIINLITRFYDIQYGQILLDDIPIQQIDSDVLRSCMALVLQDNALFSGSIHENITLGRTDISREQVVEACRLLGADSFIDKLPNQYDYELNERGSSLSMGQRQLVSLVRALVFNPQILILDEATSNIDSETEAVITKALDVVMKGRTSVVIAHRLSTILHADAIAVMHKGELREWGKHQELIEIENGLYRKLYELQYKQDSN